MEALCLHPGTVRNVAFASHVHDTYRLLEIDEKLLDAIASGQ